MEALRVPPVGWVMFTSNSTAWDSNTHRTSEDTVAPVPASLPFLIPLYGVHRVAWGGTRSPLMDRVAVSVGQPYKFVASHPDEKGAISIALMAKTF